MTITVYNKETILNEIERLEHCIVLERVVREKIELFKHRKQVNKTFCDAFEGTDFHAYIVKNNGSTTLTVRCNRLHGSQIVDFYVTAYSDEVLTWDKILSEFNRYSYQGCLKQYRDRLECLDVEIADFEQFINEFDKLEFKCFNLYSIKSDMKHALYCAKKEGMLR